MANLDTRSKRASSVNFLKPYTASLVLPDGAINQGDRQQSAWAYSGIAAAGVGGSTDSIPMWQQINGFTFQTYGLRV